MATENKFDKLRSIVHQGIPLEKPAQRTEPDKKEAGSITAEADASVTLETGTGTVVTPQSIAPDGKTIKREMEANRQAIEPAAEPDEKEVKESVEPVIKASEPTIKPVEKRRRKPQADYQSLFFTRIDFTHRKPLYITAVTHRRLMRIVHLMDESKATISSYVENIILNHLDMFREEIDTIYQTNNINPVE